MRRAVSLFTWSGAQNCSTQSWADWWVLQFSLWASGKSWDEVPEFYRDLILFRGNVSNSPPVLLCFHSLTATSRPVLILSPPHRHTHTHTAASFLTSYREQWQSECVCHCLSRKWDLGEWMEEFWRRNAIIRKAVEKRMDCYRYGLPLCWVEDLGDSFALVLIYLSIRLSYWLFGGSVNNSEPLLCPDSAALMAWIHTIGTTLWFATTLQSFINTIKRLIDYWVKCSNISHPERFEIWVNTIIILLLQ